MRAHSRLPVGDQGVDQAVAIAGHQRAAHQPRWWRGVTGRVAGISLLAAVLAGCNTESAADMISERTGLPKCEDVFSGEAAVPESGKCIDEEKAKAP